MATAIGLKIINEEKARKALKSLKPYTKTSLAIATNLSVATCGNILKDLLANGEVIEVELAESTGGRPSRQFIYNKDFSHVLAMYVRKERKDAIINYAVSNAVGEVVYEHYEEPTEINISKLDEIVKSITTEYSNIKSIAVGVPGVVIDGKVGICDFELLSNVDVRKYLSQKYKIQVVVINDVNCTALGYYFSGGFSREESLAYIYYPVDGEPGAGIIIDGKVINGVSNFAGEVSYLPHYLFKDEIKNIGFDLAPFAQGVLYTIISINSVLNPKTIILSGFQLSDEIVYILRKIIKDHLPKSHTPSILFQEDIHENYMIGLTKKALELLMHKAKL